MKEKKAKLSSEKFLLPSRAEVYALIKANRQKNDEEFCISYAYFSGNDDYLDLMDEDAKRSFLN